jgi:hypothetical protein
LNITTPAWNEPAAGRNLSFETVEFDEILGLRPLNRLDEPLFCFLGRSTKLLPFIRIPTIATVD